jgi:putative ABC transport system substrate-binding protein
MDVIVCYDAPAAFAAKAASSNTPIVFGIGADPIKVDLVDCFNRPAGHITGVYSLLNGLASKHLELVHDLFPAARTIALFVNPSNPNAHVYVPETRAGGGLRYHYSHAVLATVRRCDSQGTSRTGADRC